MAKRNSGAMNYLFKLIPPFVHDNGHCWVASLPEKANLFSDTPENPRQSGLKLFEDQVEIGIPHELHDNIRTMGKGRFSHWNNSFYFSTSDNSDPNINRRQYFIYLSEHPIDTEVMEKIGVDESKLLSVIQANVNENGKALYNLLLLFRFLNHTLYEIHFDLRGKSVLEMGASPDPGLPLIMLLNDASKYYSNNILPLRDRLSRDYAHIIYAILSSILPQDPPLLTKIGSFEEDKFILSQDKFIPIFPIPAEQIDLPDESIDLTYSFSVFEHVSSPRAVIINAFRLLKPGGVMYATIDLRDHRDFSNPLESLKYSSAEHARLFEKGDLGENLWRSSDFLKCFEETGFKVLSCWYRDTNFSLTPSGNTNSFESLLHPFGHGYKTSIKDITPWVTEGMRFQFDKRFHDKSLADLSVLVIMVVLQKPG